MKKINEEELKEIFNQIKNGNENGLKQLYEKYYSLVYGIVFSILKNKDNSEDVVQEVFAKIIKLDKSKLPSQGEASWLYIVTKNETFQFLRKQKQNIDIDDLYTLESESDEIDDIVDMNSYYKLIENLNPIDREIISLRILSDITFEKISQMLNMPLGTVQWRYYKALHSIKLSISCLATLLLIYNIRIMTQRFANNISVPDDELDKSEYSNNKNIIDGNYESFDSSISGFYFESDSSGTSHSIGRIENLFMNVSFMGICIVLLIISIYFAMKDKLKIKRKK